MDNLNQEAIDQILKSCQYLIANALKNTTKVYDGFVLSQSGTKWNVMYNNETHAITCYGSTAPTLNTQVKVFVPQGNQALAWFIVAS